LAPLTTLATGALWLERLDEPDGAADADSSEDTDDGDEAAGPISIAVITNEPASDTQPA
jgi:hypothetical protein